MKLGPVRAPNRARFKTGPCVRLVIVSYFIQFEISKIVIKAMSDEVDPIQSLDDLGAWSVDQDDLERDVTRKVSI